MEDYRKQFQELLRKLFQFDCADLDFGIYRIMNHKREAVEQFIGKDLLEAVSAELDSGALAEQSVAARQVRETATEIYNAFGKTALDARGNLSEAFHSYPLGIRYLELRKKAGSNGGQPALEATIFNHLNTFFRRYYNNGDFMSNRRYSKGEKYAIPYNGEEVVLHWANKDQYYIKTGEYFTDYTFVSNGITVHFKLQQATVEKDNVKGESRFFVPRCKESVFDGKAREILIPFEYRPLTEQEQIAYGKKNQQDAILAEAVEAIPKQLGKQPEALAALMTERRKTADGKSVSYLEYHLRQYTRRNTSDFFIHKDLKGFLERELDFYLKNEVLNIDELGAGGKARAEGWFQTMGTIKSLGRKVIAFLAQIEDFQKRLYEKKKFITSTEYCVTLDRVPEDLYPEIVKNKEQVAEWVRLFAIDEIKGDLLHPGYSKPLKVDFLKANPFLVLDTKFFDQDFKDRLLAGFENLDEETDGLLIHSENWQALNLLLERYREQVKCIYIDPPYNTGDDGFLYKDNYQHSCWVSLVDDRLNGARPLLEIDGSLMVSIDQEEFGILRLLLDHLMGHGNLISVISVKRGSVTGHKAINPGVVNVSEYVFAYAKSREEWLSYDAFTERERDDRYNLYIIDKDKPPARWSFVPLLDAVSREIGIPKTKIKEHFGDRHLEELNKYVLDHADRVARLAVVNMEGVGADFREAVNTSREERNKVIVHRRQGVPDVYLFNGQRILFYSDKVIQIGERKATAEKASDIWLDVLPNDLHNEGGVSLKKGKKPESLIQRLFTLCSQEAELVLDFFAGSGTAMAVAQKMKRRWIGVEFGEFFEDLPLTRLKNVLHGEQRGVSRLCSWKGGGFFKYLRLESYEDALNNIAFSDRGVQQAMKFSDYLLHYMLDFETRESGTFLNVESLESPFRYQLHLTEGQETRAKPVDLPETFNYLLGLKVQTRRVYQDKDRRYLVYRGSVDHQQVVVIWRDTEGWGDEDYERDRRFVSRHKLTRGADEVLVNGDSIIPKAKSLDPIFKKRMFAVV